MRRNCSGARVTDLLEWTRSRRPSGRARPGLSSAVESLPWAKFVPYEIYGSALHSAKRRRPRLARRGRGATRCVDAVEELIARKVESASGHRREPGDRRADYSFPGVGGARHLRHQGRRTSADRAKLPRRLRLTGNDVNVVVIDSGLDQSLFPPGQWGGGWQLLPSGPCREQQPGETCAARHDGGNNILAVAPQARIWDVPS